VIHIKGLSNRDIENYYLGAILMSPSGLFKINGGNTDIFSGYLLQGGVWVPKEYKVSALSLLLPKEGYVLLNNAVHKLVHKICRTRRKGFTTETYSLRPLLASSVSAALMDIAALQQVFKEEKKTDFSEAVAALKRKDYTGYVFSKNLCINKRRATKEVLLRGLKVGLLKRNKLELPSKYTVFQQELEEYGIPITSQETTCEAKQG